MIESSVCSTMNFAVLLSFITEIFSDTSLRLHDTLKHYLAGQGRPAAEQHLHAGELIGSLALQANIQLPTAGQNLHGRAVRNGSAVQRGHT